MQGTEVKLHNLGRLIAACWTEAEAETIRAVKEKYWGPAEENITFLFTSELRVTIEKASSSRMVAKAFVKDLQAIPGFGNDLAKFADGLIAKVVLHNHYHEGKKSAADLGVVLRRPFVSTTSGSARVKTDRDHARGLLAQAKLGRSTGSTDEIRKWNSLTACQVRLFPSVQKYYSLLLYRLGGHDVNDLKPFGWQLCSNRLVDEVEGWLRDGTFPRENRSSDVIEQLTSGKIGTTDSTVINSIINPESAASVDTIEIHILWPDGKGPPPYLPLRQHHTQKTQARNLLRH